LRNSGVGRPAPQCAAAVLTDRPARLRLPLLYSGPAGRGRATFLDNQSARVALPLRARAIAAIRNLVILRIAVFVQPCGRRPFAGEGGIAPLEEELSRTGGTVRGLRPDIQVLSSRQRARRLRRAHPCRHFARWMQRLGCSPEDLHEEGVVTKSRSDYDRIRIRSVTAII